MNMLLKKPVRTRTLAFLAVCALLAVAAAWAGIDDNPPGILLYYLAAASFILAWVHPWRTPRRSITLACLSIICMTLLIVLDSIVETPSTNPATRITLQITLQSIEYGVFYIGALVLPAALSSALPAGLRFSFADPASRPDTIKPQRPGCRLANTQPR